MTNFIPIFPLGIVVYPGEIVNLHIFEPRYKQLVNECYTEGKPFGIPTVIDNKLNEMGTLVKITELVKVYDSGEMDIRTQGLRVFRVLEMIKSVPDKLFSGAIVNYPDNIESTGKRQLMLKVINAIGIYPPIRPMHPGRWAPVGKKAKVFVENKDCDACRQTGDCVCMRAIRPQALSEYLQSLTAAR